MKPGSLVAIREVPVGGLCFKVISAKAFALSKGDPIICLGTFPEDQISFGRGERVRCLTPHGIIILSASIVRTADE